MASFLDTLRRGWNALTQTEEGDKPAVTGGAGTFGILAGLPIGIPSPAQRAAKLFAPLAKAQPGLDRRAAAYVAAGEASSVLSTATDPDVRTAWRNANNVWPRRDRSGAFAAGVTWAPEQVVRLGEVIAALEPIQYGWGQWGSERSPDWLRHAMTLWLGHDRKDRSPAALEAIAAAGGLGIAAVLDIMLSHDAASYGTRNSVDRFVDLSGWLVARAEMVAAAVPGLAADQRAEFAAATGRFGIALTFLDPLIDLAIGSSKKARAAAAQALTGADPEVIGVRLAAHYADAPPAARALLVEFAQTALAGSNAALLHGWRETETAPRVIAAIERALGSLTVTIPVAPNEADGSAGYLGLGGSRVVVPPRPAPPARGRIPEATLALLAPAAEDFNARLERGRAEAERGKWHWTRQFATVGTFQFDALRKLADGSYRISNQQTAIGWIRHHDRHPAIATFLDDPGVSLAHLVRFAVASTNGYFAGVFGDWSGPMGGALVRRLAAGADVRVVLDLWREAGGRDPILDHLAASWYGAPAAYDAGLWTALAERFDLLDEAMGLRPQSAAGPLQLRAALDFLALFPEVPRRYHAALMTLASGSGATVRRTARRLLADAPGIDEAIVVLLGDGRQETRAGAAEWLAQRGAVAAVPALRRALSKERSELARAALITALERLGDDVSDLFDDAAMLKEAQAGLAKAKGDALGWFPFDQLPALRWQDGRAIDPALPRWWVTLAAKLKQPGGNALFDLWLDRLAPGDAHRLGQMILVSWIEQDTRTPTLEEANAHAAALVDQTLQQNLSYVRQYPQSADYWSTDRDTVFAQLRRQKHGTYLGSAADTKGVLGLATRVTGADAAARVRAYLKDHGARTSQAKALIEMLAANPSPAALQVVLAAANRSKQRSVQAHAAALVEAVAERRGWSAEELADRTVPTAGLDADGAIEVDAGRDRAYTLRLDARDALILLNPEGKEVKALPAPRVDDEKSALDAAKKLVATARKEVKQVLAAQTERLREAMLIGRRWSRADWESFVAGHPLAGRLAQRLVWLGLDPAGEVAAAFRPLGDGTYTDAADAEVDIAAFAEVALAHPSLLGADAVAAWQAHLADYEVAAPFDQFGRALPALDAADADRRDVVDREGWIIETFQLRGIAGKLGYQRAAAVDGGWFTSYERPYRAAGIVAEIEFSGSPLPEENAAAALLCLAFRQMQPGGTPGRKLALKEVPPVLLAESRADLHEIAAKGTGFDPDWQKKVY